MSSFVHGALLWGLVIVGVPILIHLINLLRHRRVEWAPMEFLLESQKKHRTWIILKQLLLLLLRMGAIAAVVLMLAQPKIHNQWSNLFGGENTHHIILLDDSFSMSDQALGQDRSAFAEAKKTVHRLASEAQQQGTSQTFTLLRFSRAARFSSGGQPDQVQKDVNEDLLATLKKTLGKIDPSHTHAGPTAALEAIAKITGVDDQENRIVYVVSDFRANEWEEAPKLRKSLKNLNEEGVKIHFIQCAKPDHGNLAITELEPVAQTRAVGLPIRIKITVKNFGSEPVRKVPIKIEVDGHHVWDLEITEIAPDTTETDDFLVRLDSPGAHKIVAQLQDDAVALDNRRYSILDVPQNVPVLLIQGRSDQPDTRFVRDILAPGGNVRAGTSVQVERTRFLSATPQEKLNRFRAIFLLDIGHLDEPEIKSLEAYVRSGGGVAFFLGELTDPEFFNEHLYRKGKGLFPAPIMKRAQLLVDRLETAPDVKAIAHPIWGNFFREDNSPMPYLLPLLQDLFIHHYFKLLDQWTPGPEVRVIATLRNGDPLILERRAADPEQNIGRVVAVLTKASHHKTQKDRVWNNWPKGPMWVVCKQLQVYLDQTSDAPTSNQVDAPLRFQFLADKFDTLIKFYWPDTAGEDRKTAEVKAKRSRENSLMAVAQIGGSGMLDETNHETDLSGIYEVRVNKSAGRVETHLFAFNVESSEGNLKRLEEPELETQLPGIKFEYHDSGMFTADKQQLAKMNLGEVILYLLIFILIGEQILAYSASYHTTGKGGAT